MTTQDLPALSGLRWRAGETQVSLDAFELNEGCRPTDPLLIARHCALLEQNEESQRWLRVAVANIEGKMNFIPKTLSQSKPRKTTATN